MAEGRLVVKMGKVREGEPEVKVDLVPVMEVEEVLDLEAVGVAMVPLDEAMAVAAAATKADILNYDKWFRQESFAELVVLRAAKTMT